jgi:NADH-quinone oxidoreductase subunit H
VAFITLLMGLDQASVPGWFGGMRSAAQAISGAFPALIAILTASVRSEGFRWSAYVSTQGAWPHQWAAFSSPFEFIAFVVFLVSGSALIGAPPLEAGASVPDLHGGVSSAFRGERLVLFGFSRFYGFFLWSVIAVTLFLGGWSLPPGFSDFLRGAEAWRSIEVLQLVALLLKVFVLMIAISLIAAVSPRLRADQVTDMCWKVLSPFSLFALAGSVLWVGWRTLG